MTLFWRKKKKRSHFLFLYLWCQTVHLFLITLCQPLSSPDLFFSLLMCPLISMSLSTPCCSLSLLCLCVVSSSLYSLSSLDFFYFICHFPPSSVSFSSLFSLWSFVSLSLFAFSSCILFFEIIVLYLSFSPFVVFCWYPRQFYFSALLSLSPKPWRWIIEQTDPWLYSCCLGVMHWSFLIPYRFF